jgi:hypothetical protein
MRKNELTLAEKTHEDICTERSLVGFVEDDDAVPI